MDIFEIEGPVQLAGTIEVAGSKNSALPIMAAMILPAGSARFPMRLIWRIFSPLGCCWRAWAPGSPAIRMRRCKLTAAR